VWLLLTVVAAAMASRCAANESGWLLNQKSRITGECKLYISASGIKIVYEKQGYCFVSSAPDWQAVIYSDKNKIFYRTTLEDHAAQMTRGMKIGGNNDIDAALWKKAEPCMLNGYKTTRYVYRAKKIDAEIDWAECWSSDEIQVAKPLAQYISQVNHTPCNGHLSIRFIEHYRGDIKKKAPRISTTNVEKITIPVGCYSWPKNYRQAASYMQVVMGEAGAEVLDDMYKSMDKYK